MPVQFNEIPLFKGYEVSEVESFLSRIIFQRKNFTPGSLIVSQGETCNRLLILIEGKVVGEMTSPAGKSLKIEEMEAPMVLASAFLFGKRTIFPVTVTALTQSSFIVIQRDDLMKLFHIGPGILINFLSMISS
ncbi:MAG: Crp/Fnr family transcriptional regulator, partial [Prolixibacteraceae bacterium]|nr:Crp/Fnr family transcriptional regulator [Prolixibacteraceae bacterium]